LKTEYGTGCPVKLRNIPMSTKKAPKDDITISQASQGQGGVLWRKWKNILATNGETAPSFMSKKSALGEFLCKHSLSTEGDPPSAKEKRGKKGL